MCITDLDIVRQDPVHIHQFGICPFLNINISSVILEWKVVILLTNKRNTFLCPNLQLAALDRPMQDHTVTYNNIRHTSIVQPVILGYRTNLTCLSGTMVRARLRTRVTLPRFNSIIP